MLGSHLHWHGTQVGTKKEEPHELLCVSGHQITDLRDGHVSHGHVGGTQAHDLIVDFTLKISNVDDGPHINME